MEKIDEQMTKIFQAKKGRRKELAQLPIEKKLRILIELQKIASPIFLARGLRKIPWKI